MKRRALVLAYYVPPRRAIASVRTGQLIEALRRADWDVTAVTPDFDDTQFDNSVHTTGVVDFKAPVRRLLGVSDRQTTHDKLGVTYGSVGATGESQRTLRQRAIRFGYDVTEFANRRFGWISHGSKAISDLIRNQRFDLVVSTSPPETTHLVASRVHGTIPWIADLRDPWVREDGLRGPQALTMLDRALEPRTFRSAHALMTVSDPIANTLRARYPGKEVYTVRNAFSESEWDGVPFVRPPRATFMYAGQLYSGRRDPRPLLEAIAYLLREGLIGHDEIQVDFYGEPAAWLDQQIQQYGLRRCVHQHGPLPRASVLEKERAATRLLLLLWDDPGERGTYTGKLFEYLGSRTPMIVCGGPEESVVDDVLSETGAGSRHRSAHGLRDAVLSAVKEWRAGTPSMLCADAVRPYEFATLADDVARIADQCTTAYAP